MKLTQIIEQVKTQFKVLANEDLIAKIDIKNIAIDSRLVKEGDVFFALKGLKNDGAQFAFSSAQLGARVVVISSQSLFEINKFQQQFPKVIVFACADNFALLIEFLKIFYEPLPKNIYGVTGTNGKTSSVEYIRQILNFLNIKSASIGTLGVNCDQEIKEQLALSSLTTPDIVALYRNLHILKKFAIDDVAIEVSSIGLDQQRIAGLKVNCAGFTNFSQDHLDYHQSMENYLQCKLKLFSDILDESGVAVINSDIEEFEKIKKICDKRKIKIIDYGNNGKVLKLRAISSQLVSFEFAGQIFEFKMAINGDFQAYNLLCALGCV
ncbi:MAG: Mur ligase family protein, partial [Alphaproteobacteria bacterium]